jgi:signal transduction histidine kinase
VPHDFQNDLDTVAAIAAIPTILEVVCRTTGLRFAAVARVTDDRWVCLASKDDVQFGLASGGELEVGTTICNEIREHRRAGAIDPHPNTLNNPSVLGMFTLFAKLIAHELESHASMRAVEQENEALKQAFRAGLGHDMKNTLMAMAAGTRLLGKTQLDERARMILAQMENATNMLSRQIADAMGPVN